MQRRTRGSARPGPAITRQRLVRLGVLIVLMIGASLVSRFQGTPEGGNVTGSVRLVDGDSFFIGQTEVRMQGIDAPEGRQTCRDKGRERRCGEDARRELQKLIGGRPVRCEVHSKDQHGRLLATCFAADGTNLNQQMVALGWAVDFGGYGREEASARAEARGLWAMEFERPRDWRRSNGVGG